MGYIDANLMEGEKLVYRTKLHPAVLMFPMLCIAIALVVVPPALFGPYVAFIPAVWLAVALANHGVSELGITNKRLLLKRGYLPKRVLDSPLEKIEGIKVTQSALSKKIGYGTVIVRGKDGSSHSFSEINHPLEFARMVEEQMGGKKKQDTGR
jgi:uncharacterized membrane protein YdbT with pleckstrin-like domain